MTVRYQILQNQRPALMPRASQIEGGRWAQNNFRLHYVMKRLPGTQFFWAALPAFPRPTSSCRFSHRSSLRERAQRRALGGSCISPNANLQRQCGCLGKKIGRTPVIGALLTADSVPLSDYPENAGQALCGIVRDPTYDRCRCRWCGSVQTAPLHER